MGFLDALKQEAMAAVKKFAGEHPQLGQEVMQLVQGSPGGLSGLVQQMQNAGLGPVVQSWISTGPNKPISAAQIQQALGSDKVKEIAARLGLDPNAASQKLSSLLPEIIDRLTPNGQMPQGTPPTR